MTGVWNKTNTRKLIELAAADISTFEISKSLGIKPKLIVGKLERMAQSRTHKRVPVEVRARPQRVLLGDLDEHTCRWPLWEADAPETKRFFCGAWVDGHVYCATHEKLAYQRTNPDGRVQANYKPYYPGEGRFKETR